MVSDCLLMSLIATVRPGRAFTTASPSCSQLLASRPTTPLAQKKGQQQQQHTLSQSPRAEKWVFDGAGVVPLGPFEEMMVDDMESRAHAARWRALPSLSMRAGCDTTRRRPLNSGQCTRVPMAASVRSQRIRDRWTGGRSWARIHNGERRTGLCSCMHCLFLLNLLR